MGKVAFSKVLGGDFLRGPGVKAQPSNIRGMGSISGWGTKVPHAMGVAKIKKKKTILNKKYWESWILCIGVGGEFFYPKSYPGSVLGRLQS